MSVEKNFWRQKQAYDKRKGCVRRATAVALRFLNVVVSFKPLYIFAGGQNILKRRAACFRLPSATVKIRARRTRYRLENFGSTILIGVEIEKSEQGDLFKRGICLPNNKKAFCSADNDSTTDLTSEIDFAGNV